MGWELLLWLFEHWAHGSTEQAFGAHHADEALEERGSRTSKEMDRAGTRPGRKEVRQASTQETRSTGLLGPGRAQTSSQLEVLGESTVIARGGWQVTLKLMRSGAPCAVLTRRLINLTFFICFWELKSFEWVGICWLSEMARRQVNQKGKRRGIRTWKKYMAEEVNTFSIC